MQIKIRNKQYNTGTAKKISEYFYGQYGEEAGYSEILYKKKTQEFFLHCSGGAKSIYPKETIKPLTLQETRQWMQRHNCDIFIVI